MSTSETGASSVVWTSDSINSTEKRREKVKEEKKRRIKEWKRDLAKLTKEEDQIKELLVERLFLDLEPSQIQNETLLSEYGVDSFLMLELVVAMEEIFAVHFEPADITAAALKTVSSLATLIRSKQHQ